MLLAADRSQEEFDAEIPALNAERKLVPHGGLAASNSRPYGSYGHRYGESRPVNVWAISLAVLIHIVLIAAVLHVRSEGVAAKREKLTVVDLSSPPPPPPPAAAEQPKKQPPVAAPPPLITIPRPAPQITTSPIIEPLPAPASLVAAPAAPVTSPVSAPVTSPAPSIIESSSLGTKMMSGAPPRYPVESRRQREQGTVVLSLTLGTDGAVSSISIAQSSGSSRLDDAALRAVRKWRWAPTLRNGQAVMVRGQVEIPFVLQG